MSMEKPAEVEIYEVNAEGPITDVILWILCGLQQGGGAEI